MRRSDVPNYLGPALKGGAKVVKARIRGRGSARFALLAVATLVAASLPFVAAPTPAAAADVVLPPIFLTGVDSEDDGNGNGNPASRVDTWSYQLKNPNPFDLMASIQVNSDSFVDGDTGLPTGSWLQTQVTAVLVPANSSTGIVQRLAVPPAMGTPANGLRYAFRATWNEYPTVESNYTGLRWPELTVVPISLGAAFTDPGPPFIGVGGVIEGFIDNRGPDFVSGLACEFDASGVPTGEYTHEWWVQNTAFTGNPEILNVRLTGPNEAAVSGVSGLPRQTVDWAVEHVAIEPVAGSAVVAQTWQHGRAWFRPLIDGQNPGGTAADNTYPWNGSTPPGTVWARVGSQYNKHTTTLLQADDCAVKYANLPVHNPPGPPAVAVSEPTAGATVGGTFTVEVDATDDDAVGTLNVEASTDGGATWNSATWNAASSRYEYPWDTTVEPDGPGTVDARATDSDTNTTNATQINVTVDNSPTVAITSPAGGATVGGTFSVEVDATDNDPAGSLTVDVSTDNGATWTPATWNAANSRYEYPWDTTVEPDGPGTV
ncbi:MAG: hypothetical protein GY720_14885, partial [bacterium]|nr:hypothetical protein [bacterium]